MTSKIWPTGYADPTAIDRMLSRLNPDYVDLVYPHQPAGDINILRWEIQEGLLTIPGAINPDYIHENIAAAQGEVHDAPFVLTPEEMEQMRRLNKEQRFFNASYEQAKRFALIPIRDA